ncbi:hypothetical protein IG631_22134 [Alternaria alternata]|nr:hypothetical protein IG631_22134 [Alternaria alternata]
MPRWEEWSDQAIRSDQWKHPLRGLKSRAYPSNLSGKHGGGFDPNSNTSMQVPSSQQFYPTQLHHCGGGAYDPNNPTKPVVVVQHQPVSQLQPTFSPQVRILLPLLSHYPDRSKDTSHKLLPALSTVSSTSTAERKQPAGIHYSAVWLFQVNRSTLPSPWSRMTLKHQSARSRHMNMLLRTKAIMERTKSIQAFRP